MTITPLSSWERKQALQEHVSRERRAVLVVNTQSRRGAKGYGRAKILLLRAGVILDATYPVRDPARLREIVREAIAAGHRLIIVGGGDGTLSSVVDDFAHQDVVLGVLPLGTSNSFARALGLPLALEGAITVIAQGRVGDIDLACINRDYFLNTASIGVSASVARATPAWSKRLFGTLAYFFVSAALLPRQKTFHCRIEHGDQVDQFDAMQILIANGSYHGGALVVPDAHVESRDVIALIVTSKRARDLARMWWDSVRGAPQDPRIVTQIRMRSGIITTTPQQYVSIDGEVAMQTPVQVSVAEEALLVILPPGFDERDE